MGPGEKPLAPASSPVSGRVHGFAAAGGAGRDGAPVHPDAAGSTTAIHPYVLAGRAAAPVAGRARWGRSAGRLLVVGPVRVAGARPMVAAVGGAPRARTRRS